MVDAGADGFHARNHAVDPRGGRHRTWHSTWLPPAILVSRAIQRNDHDELGQYVHAMEELAVTAIGLNCSGGPRHALPILQQLSGLTNLYFCHAQCWFSHRR